MSGKRIAVIGHRGARNLEPENTMRSFRRAIELGVDYIECDVHRTRDDQLVLMHDHTVDRTTDGAGRVNEMSFAEVRRLDAGKGERVPTLDELCDLVRGRLQLHVELKDPTAVDLTLARIDDLGCADQVYLTSGDTAVLRDLRQRRPGVRLEHIFSEPPPDALDRARSAGVQRVSCHFTKLSQAFVDACHVHGIEVIGWPPNTPDEQQQTVAYAVDLICSDRPDILIETLAALGRRTRR